MNKTIILNPVKCEFCDSEFCEYWIWCKAKNMEEGEADEHSREM